MCAAARAAQVESAAQLRERCRRRVPWQSPRRRARDALREGGVARLRGGASQASRAGGVDAAAQGMGVQQEHADGGAAMGVGRECVEMQGGLRASSAAVKRSAWCPWNMVAAAWQEKTGPRSRHTDVTVAR